MQRDYPEKVPLIRKHAAHLRAIADDLDDLIESNEDDVEILGLEKSLGDE
jgi:hypothetical protein